MGVGEQAQCEGEPSSVEVAADGAPNTLGLVAHTLAREEGVIVRGIRDHVALSPPLVVTHDELERMFAALGRALDRLWASG